jgi:hypothetical protein
MVDALAVLLRELTEAVSMIVGGFRGWWERRRHA